MPEENPQNVDAEDRKFNDRWKERRARMEEQQRLANEEIAREKKRKTDIEDAILDIAASQKVILKELAFIRKRLTGKG